MGGFARRLSGLGSGSPLSQARSSFGARVQGPGSREACPGRGLEAAGVGSAVGSVSRRTARVGGRGSNVPGPCVWLRRLARSPAQRVCSTSGGFGFSTRQSDSLLRNLTGRAVPEPCLREHPAPFSIRAHARCALVADRSEETSVPCEPRPDVTANTGERSVDDAADGDGGLMRRDAGPWSEVARMRVALGAESMPLNGRLLNGRPLNGRLSTRAP